MLDKKFVNKSLKLILRKCIKRKFNILKKSCSYLRPLSNVYIFSDEGTHIDFKQLIASWDNDFRPEIRSSLIRFLNVKNYSIILENGEVIPFIKLNVDELKNIHDYMNIMVHG